MARIEESTHIPGVYIVNLKPYGDDRGRFVEIFRKEWFPQQSWNVIQSNRSESASGVLRGLHYHKHQVDYWHVISGKIRVVLVDLRKTSPARGVVQIIDVSGQDNIGLFIPVGVAHGFATLTQATLIYLVDNYYDGADEFGVAWNDPDLNVNWGLSDPIMSPRDKRNPYIREIPEDELPG